MVYNTVECPHCGNPTTARATDETQKCKYCRRLFKVDIVRRGPVRKWRWTVEQVDFPEPAKRPEAPPKYISVFDRDKFGY